MSAPSSSPDSGRLGYWEETRRPVYSAVLVLPFVLTYEIGMLVFRPKVINGGDALIRSLLRVVSVHTAFASALLLLVCFGVWQFRTRASWKIEPSKLGLMFLESLLFAEILFLFLGWISLYMARAMPGAGALLAAPGGGAERRLVTWVLYCGAGVYEELVFRVLLLGLLMLFFTRVLKVEKGLSAAWAVLIGALLFSLFHYGPGGDRFAFGSFAIRTFAGVYFSALYVTRSFGVAAAAHALYDIRVGWHPVFHGP